MSGMTVRAFAAKFGYSECTVRRWIKQKDKLEAFKRTKGHSVKECRRLVTIGRKGYFPRLEAELYNWIVQRNQMGLRIKDKYIMAKALKIKEELLAKSIQEPVGRGARQMLKQFVASHTWCMRFRKRFGLVVRRHTTCRQLPEGFAAIAREYVRSVQALIKEHQIELGNIINLDQVPRYFETENNSTITKKGQREVFLKKSSTSHKRFTFTPVISAAGKFVALHVLFSNLKKKPTVDARCLVDVNGTGMWNGATIKVVVDEIIKRCQTVFFEPMLVILDSYGSHIKFIEEHRERYARRKVFFSVIPACMTGLLQPLDVAVNRSFQQHYGDHYTEFVAAGISDTSLQTKAGNIRMPKYSIVSKWVADWAESFPEEAVSKAFQLCGLIPEEMFSIEKLNKPLAECFAPEVDEALWHIRNAEVVTAQTAMIDVDEWETFEGEFALAHAIHAIFGDDEDFDFWVGDFINKIQEEIKQDAVLDEFFDKNESDLLEKGFITSSKVDIAAIAKIFSVDICFLEYNENFEELSETNFMSGKDAQKKISMFQQAEKNVVGVKN